MTDADSRAGASLRLATPLFGRRGAAERWRTVQSVLRAGLMLAPVLLAFVLLAALCGHRTPGADDYAPRRNLLIRDTGGSAVWVRHNRSA